MNHTRTPSPTTILAGKDFPSPVLTSAPIPGKPASRFRRAIRLGGVFGRTRSSNKTTSTITQTIAVEQSIEEPTYHDVSCSTHPSDAVTHNANSTSATTTPSSSSSTSPQRPPPRRAVRPRAADIFEGGRRYDWGVERDWDIGEMIEGSEGVDDREGELPQYDKHGRPPKYGELSDIGRQGEHRGQVAEGTRTGHTAEFPPRTPPPRYSTEFTTITS
ncbi:hypothetical protein VNI00_015455 [Paramarasmius palmivorus]|uniref:Uncharacterized protein n=1 Tax=Paramarasmius palmivorus TaxID=297713 RepID=A0AAW0BLL0_9AGAR